MAIDSEKVRLGLFATGALLWFLTLCALELLAFSLWQTSQPDAKLAGVLWALAWPIIPTFGAIASSVLAVTYRRIERVSRSWTYLAIGSIPLVMMAYGLVYFDVSFGLRTSYLAWVLGLLVLMHALLFVSLFVVDGAPWRRSQSE